MSLSDLLESNRASLHGRLEEACRRAGRPPGAVRLVAVTKSVSPPVALALARAGERDLGENRIEGLEEKARFLAEAGLPPADPAAGPDAPGVRWHFLGHVQGRKARRVVRVAHTLHSVDSLERIADLARIGREEARLPRLFLQVKLTEEEAKTGLEPAALEAALDAARSGGIPPVGLMTMAPLVAEALQAETARATFERLARLAAALPGDAFAGGRPLLSMGMSGDFEAAIAAGADVVRIGTALFEGLPEELRARPTGVRP